uniref:AAA+ ATPase domain-containing protein n=1 Tax=viral metagenome TaxID=1070528 RepID=A0A6C0HZY9_9ZZZZ
MQQILQTNIPWVEKYRPKRFQEIVLDPINRTIFKNIINKKYFPNLLFYGPPGTGKTTTIINLINEYQQTYYKINNATIIHLNASDERGIDIIRNQIYQFVKTRNMFEKGLKFVILDEVDYMTKNAQQALKYLLQSVDCENVRFCLICNYITKIDESLKNEFIGIKFNQLPKKEIQDFIRHVVDSENIQMTDEVIETIQTRFKSDIRSMVNFIQLNQHILDWNENIITDKVCKYIHELLTTNKAKDSVSTLLDYFQETSEKYNIDKISILKMYFNYLISKEIDSVSSHVLDIMENVLHVNNANIETILKYVATNMYM